MSSNRVVLAFAASTLGVGLSLVLFACSSGTVLTSSDGGTTGTSGGTSGSGTSGTSG